uniref:Uncharacterized protein n=1 Tax=Linepithema humile C virus 1 TaxID=2259784 RepID=A0A2Z4Z4D3_9VIRU|nr:hypothetical protein [Linepithema humile C virus 1]
MFTTYTRSLVTLVPPVTSVVLGGLAYKQRQEIISLRKQLESMRRSETQWAVPSPMSAVRAVTPYVPSQERLAGAASSALHASWSVLRYTGCIAHGTYGSLKSKIPTISLRWESSEPTSNATCQEQVKQNSYQK